MAVSLSLTWDDADEVHFGELAQFVDEARRGGVAADTVLTAVYAKGDTDHVGWRIEVEEVSNPATSMVTLPQSLMYELSFAMQKVACGDGDVHADMPVLKKLKDDLFAAMLTVARRVSREDDDQES